jgi:hypothetical protein
MKLLVLKRRYKKSTIDIKVLNKLKTYTTCKGGKDEAEHKNLKDERNEKNLELGKYVDEIQHQEIKIDNVRWNKKTVNKGLYKKETTKKQTFASYNYFTPLDDTYSNYKGKITKKKIMTSIDENEDIQAFAALDDYVKQIQDTTINDQNAAGGGWQEVGKKQKEKIKQAVNEQNSNRYLPRMLMPGRHPSSRNPITTKKIQLTVKLRSPTDTKAHFNTARILVAVMKTLQSIHPDTYLGCINETIENYERYIIHDTDDIPTDDRELTDYVAIGGDLRQWIGKMVNHTNNELISYKISPQIRGYLARENLVIEVNELYSINPPNVGSLETAIARHETLDLHKSRILKKLPKNIPNFQLCVSTLYVCPGISCRIIMMKADPDDVLMLQEEMAKLSTGVNKIPFFQWGEYLALSKEQKISLVNHQLKWHSAFRSVILKGFKENIDDIKMKLEEDTAMETNAPADYLIQTSVVNYFRKHVQAGNGTNLFAYVYAPINGTIEFLIKAQHDSEAKEYLKKAISELVKRMSHKSIEDVFESPDEAMKIAEATAPWRPYTRALTLIPPVMPTGDNINTSVKRLRNQDTYINTPITNSYATVTSGTSMGGDYNHNSNNKQR